MRRAVRVLDEDERLLLCADVEKLRSYARSVSARFGDAIKLLWECLFLFCLLRALRFSCERKC